MSSWKDRIQKVKNDLEDNLKSQRTQEEFKKIKDGAKQIVDGAKHVSGQLVQKPDDSSVAVVVEDPKKDEAPIKSEPNTKSKINKDIEANIKFKGLWDQKLGQKPNQGDFSNLASATAITEFAIYHNKKVIGSWKSKEPVLVSKENLKVVEDLVGNFAWNFEEWQDRANTTGWLVGKCSLSNIFSTIEWKVNQYDSSTWNDKANLDTWNQI